MKASTTGHGQQARPAKVPNPHPPKRTLMIAFSHFAHRTPIIAAAPPSSRGFDPPSSQPKLATIFSPPESSWGNQFHSLLPSFSLILAFCTPWRHSWQEAYFVGGEFEPYNHTIFFCSMIGGGPSGVICRRVYEMCRLLSSDFNFFCFYVFF
jgi:hypothetical protein